MIHWPFKKRELRSLEKCLECGDRLPKYACPFCSKECAENHYKRQKARYDAGNKRAIPVWPLETRVGLGAPCTYMKKRREDKR